MDAVSGAALFATAMTAAFALTFVARWTAPRLGFVDRPGGRKTHLQATPLLGGAAVYLACLIGLGASLLFTEAGHSRFTFWLCVGGALFCTIGVVDDRWSLRARDKFLLQIAGSLPFALSIQSVESIRILDLDLPLGWLGVAFTVFWLVACTNAVNLLDGIDGLASSIGVILCLAVGVVGWLNGRTESTAMAVVLCGALVGFLFHNRPPAKIFLGDAGSLTIGFMTGALAIEGSTKKATGLMLSAPLIVMCIPAFDAFLAIARRKLSGRGIGVADRGHIHHRLLERGLSGSQTLLVITCFSLATAGSAIAATYFQSDLLGLAICGLLLVLLIVGRVCGNHEVKLFCGHLELAGAVLFDATGLFRSRLAMTRLQMADPEQRETFWDEICQAASAVGAQRLTFEMTQGPRRSVRYWRSDAEPQRDSANWRTEYSVSRDMGEALVTVEGADWASSHPRRMNDLFAMIARLCRTWPEHCPVGVETDGVANNEEPTTVSMAPPLPRQRAA